MASERLRRRIDRLLDQAEAAADRRDWDRVRDVCDQVLRIDPENGDARAYLDAADRDTGVAVPGSVAPGARTAVDESKTSNRATPKGLTRAVESATAETSVPTSFASGRYMVEKFLGQGGKKKVYLAHDATLDRHVAFALIKTEGLDDTSRQRITREAQAMGRIGDHPNVVPIYDLGQEKDPVTGVDQPFMVLPLMTGGAVEGLIEKAPDHRIPLEQALQIAKDTCEGLMFAHSKGIVHRDLKPGNVWLSEDGRARIGDFGLAVATDRSRLTREGMMVGTVAYMPPEQAMGGEITRRADLYSLGAMLYEMVTGRPPFLGDDDIAVIGQHINTPPVAPTWHNPQCPKTLDTLIMRLLSKDPSQRPESANDVLRALAAVRPADSNSAAQSGAEQRRSLDSVSSGVFVGRQKEMDQLKSALEEALSGRGRMLAVVGDPGIGKSRISAELATYAGLRGCLVIWGRCYEGVGAPPYWPWIQAIRAYLSTRDSDQIRKEMGPTASVIAEIVPEVRDRIPELQAPQPIEDPESARFRLFDSITTVIKNASRTQPVVLLLDDLHWADKPSLTLLEFLVRELASCRVLLLGTYRDVELNRRHPLSATLGDLTRERLFERVLLRGLDRQDVERFFEIAANVRPSKALIDTVLRHTEGNPLFVTETVRLLVQEGSLQGTREGSAGRHGSTGESTWELRIPEGVREVIGRRLDRLSERCNDVLTTAAVIGRQFRFQILKDLVGASPGVEERISEDRLLDVLDEALSARIVEELPAELGLYQFTHALLQETLLDELSLTRRVRLHARIAEALEREYGDQHRDRAAEIARHFEQAQTILGTERFVKYSIQAGDVALAAYAFEESRDHFQKALDAVGPADTDTDSRQKQARIREGLGRSQLAMGDIPDAFASLSFAFDRYLDSGDVNAALRTAMVPVPAYYEEAHVRFLEKALELAEPGSAEAATILSRLGFALGWARGNYVEARSRLTEALALAERLDDRSLQSWVQGRTATVELTLGDPKDALSHAVKGAQLARETGEFASAVHSLCWNALALLSLGDLRGARESAAKACEAADSSRQRLRQYMAHSTAATAEMLAGDWERARAELALESVPDYSRMLRVSVWLDWYLDTDVGPTAAGDLMDRAGDSWTARITALQLISTAALLAYRSEVPDKAALIARALSLAGRGMHATAPARLLVEGLLAIVNGDTAEMSRAQQSLRNAPDLAGTFGVVLPMPVAIVRGHLCAALGDRAQADLEFESAIAFCRNAGYRPELAWSCALYSEHLFTGDNNEVSQALERARRFQEEALSIATQLGMKPLVERILRRREILKA